MTEPAPTRVCTLCRTRFVPRTARGLGCGVYFVVFVGVVALDAGLRPGPLISLGLGLAAAVIVGWVLQRMATSRERVCTSCGSQQTIPLESPAAAAGSSRHRRWTRSPAFLWLRQRLHPRPSLSPTEHRWSSPSS